MALYTYVADRRELLDLMYDRVHAGLPRPEGDDWPARVVAWSAAILECYLRHPWVVEVSFARSVLGPHEQRALELLLEALAPAGLDTSDTAPVVAALFGLARSTASTIADARRSAAVSDEHAWWTARTEALAEVVPDFAKRFPLHRGDDRRHAGRNRGGAGVRVDRAGGGRRRAVARAPGTRRLRARRRDAARGGRGNGRAPRELARRDGLTRPQAAGRRHPLRDRRHARSMSPSVMSTSRTRSTDSSARRRRRSCSRRNASRSSYCDGLPETSSRSSRAASHVPSPRVHRTTWTSRAASRSSSRRKSTSRPCARSWYARAERWKRSMIQE